MKRSIFTIYLLVCFCLAGQGMAAVNHWLGGAAGAETDWNTAANWSLGRIPVPTDQETDISDRATKGFPVIAAGQSHTVHSVLLGWWDGKVSSLTLEPGSTLTANVFMSFAHGGALANVNILTVNDASVICDGPIQIGIDANGDININGQSSYFYSGSTMDTAYRNPDAHAQVNLAGGLMEIGRIVLNPDLTKRGTWNIHITNIDAGTRFVSRQDSASTIQSYIDSGNITSDVSIYAVPNADGYVEVIAPSNPILPPTNLALAGTATQSSTSSPFAASFAIDNFTGTYTHTSGTANPWWELELDGISDIGHIVVYNRVGYLERIVGATLKVLDSSRTQIGSTYTFTDEEVTYTIDNNQGAYADAKYILVEQTGNYLSLCEVQAWNTLAPIVHRIDQIMLTTVDSDATASGTSQSYNQKVVENDNGIFTAYHHYRDDNNSSNNIWRLARSTDGGRSFTTIYEKAAPTCAPVIETDADNNIYLSYPAWDSNNYYLYRFFASDNYATPSITVIPDVSCGGKFAMTYDAARGQLYIAAQAGKLLTVGTDGVLRRSLQLLTSGSNAHPAYPLLKMDADGNLHHAWTSAADDQNAAPYYSIHHMLSSDGGITWQNMGGSPISVPCAAGDTGQAIMINLPDEIGVNTWLHNMLPKDGKVHFCYSAGSPLNRMHYMRYDMATGIREIDTWDQGPWSGSEITIFGGSGFFVKDSDLPGSTLYAVSHDAQAHIVCLASNDNGTTWYDFARSVSPQSGPFAIGGCNELSSNARVIGSFTETGGGRNVVNFLQVRTKIADLSEDGDVNLVDFAMLSNAWSSTPSDGNWDADCDISDPADYVIDVKDAEVLFNEWLLE